VPLDEALKFADSNDLAFMETSAKTDVGVSMAFSSVVQGVVWHSLGDPPSLNCALQSMPGLRRLCSVLVHRLHEHPGDRLTCSHHARPHPLPCSPTALVDQRRTACGDGS
jgi:hypothetical protein